MNKPTAEELLQPRYKVIADYPKSDYVVGQILENIGSNYCAFLDQYPHIFRHLEWWQERKEEDMPQYVKFPNGKVFKTADFDNGWVYVESEQNEWHISHTLPATETEYLASPNKQVCKMGAMKR